MGWTWLRDVLHLDLLHSELWEREMRQLSLPWAAAPLLSSTEAGKWFSVGQGTDTTLNFGNLLSFNQGSSTGMRLPPAPPDRKSVV